MRNEKSIADLSIELMKRLIETNKLTFKNTTITLIKSIPDRHLPSKDLAYVNCKEFNNRYFFVNGEDLWNIEKMILGIRRKPKIRERKR